MTEHVLPGLLQAFTGEALFHAGLGALLGTVVGVLPGIGPVATIALLLPISFQMNASGALIMLAGVYYGAQYGSSTTAILINVPGEASGTVTAIEGHRLARSGRAAEALAVAALSSLMAGLIAAVIMAFATPPLAAFALAVGPAETASMLLGGAVLAVVASDGSLARAVLMMGLGGLVGLVGTPGGDGQPRFSFGISELRDGFAFTPLVVGLFGLPEVITLMTRSADERPQPPRRWWPGYAAIRGWEWPALRGSLIGSLVGLLPGSNTLLASFLAYGAEKRLKRPGAYAGVAAPEAANNAAAQTSFVVLFGLGLPANAATAVLVGAMMLNGLPPGPALFSHSPQLFWTFTGSLITANIMLVVLNLPLVGVWARLVLVPPAILAPAILLAAGLGILVSGGSPFDVVSLAAFGVFGHTCRRGGFPLMPMLMGYVIAGPLEDNLRLALTHARGDWTAVLANPVMLMVVLLAALGVGFRSNAGAGPKSAGRG